MIVADMVVREVQCRGGSMEGKRESGGQTRRRDALTRAHALN